MIINANGSSRDKEAILNRIEDFLEIADDADEEIRFSVSFGQAKGSKFRTTDAINGLEELIENHSELLEKHEIRWEIGEALDQLESLKWMIDEELLEGNAR